MTSLSLLKPYGLTLPRQVRFILALCPLVLVLFFLLRLFLMIMNWDQMDAPRSLLVKSYLIGTRFDLAITAYILLVLLAALWVFRGRAARWVLIAFGVFLEFLVFFGIAEAEFYREFQCRYNSLVFIYLSHPGIVAEMIWESYPVTKFLLVGLAISIPLILGYVRLCKRYLHPEAGTSKPPHLLVRLASSLALVFLLVIASRGGAQPEPIRWGNAFFSESPFPNHLALNGFFSLGLSVLENASGKHNWWAKQLSQKDALRTTRQMVLLPDETVEEPDKFPLLRHETTPRSGLAHGRSTDGTPPNVVLILMESFSARYVGALGSRRHLTPEFDRLSQDGILFERAFSNGTHTHQGVFASLISFPNLPGYEYLMKTMEANQEFSSLPLILSNRNYQTIFLYNGLFSWDNKEGFFRKHGISRFIGTTDFVNPTFRDEVWGVSDQDVFVRANEEFKAMAKKGPFFSAILTLSNHVPFNLPPLPFERLHTARGGTVREERYKGIRYADWALGEFFRASSKEDYFKNTLFVMTGDHGVGVSREMITDMNLSRYHVPLLFYAPELLAVKPGRRQTVASQVDIIPSIIGLLGLGDIHQSWGRNLFSPALTDEGFAVIKPSGNDDIVALIEGDRALVKRPKAKAELFRYSLAIPPRPSVIISGEEPERTRAMEKRLFSYVQTALVSLRSRSLGISRTSTQNTMAVESAPAAASPMPPGKR